MPRDASGNYDLPAGNPVTSGTVIESTWANATMSDIGVALTDSLSRTGNGGMLVPLLFADGTVANPGVGFVNQPNLGFHRAGASDLRVVMGGATVMGFTPTLVTIPQALNVTGNITFGGTLTGIINANTLEGNNAAFYRNAANMNAGILPAARLSGSYTITASNATNAVNATTASNALALNGQPESAFGRLAQAESVTGAWTFANNIVANGLNLNTAIAAIQDKDITSAGTTDGSLTIPYSATNAIVINWGTIIAMAVGVTDNFTTPFTQVYQAVATGNLGTISISSITNTQINLSGGNGAIARWIAIGRRAI